MEAAPAAIPVKPNNAATIATTKKIPAHLSISEVLFVSNKSLICYYHID